MCTAKCFVTVVIFRAFTIFSEMTSRSDPESNMALVMNESPVSTSTILTATIGRITSSVAWTSFLVAVAPSHISVVPSGVTTPVGTAARGLGVMVGGNTGGGADG